MKVKQLLFALCLIFVGVIQADAQIGKRWYSYADYMSNSVPSVDYSILEMWNDTTGVFGDMSTGSPTYGINTFTSCGLSFAPVLDGWNDVSLYGSTIKVGPNDGYIIDSVRIYGAYMRNNARTSPKDTLRLAFVYGNGSGSTNMPAYTLTGGSLLSDYGADPLNYLEMPHDSLNNRAGRFTSVVTTTPFPYVQTIILSSTDTSSGFARSYALTTPYTVPAGSVAGASLTFKSGDASYHPFDTILYASGDYKYGDFLPLLQFNGVLGSPSFPPYNPLDSNVGYIKLEGAGDGPYGGLYTPNWAWRTAFGASELQYPVIEYHINCPTCDLNDVITGTTSACAGSTSPLAFSLTGGTWSTSDLSVATVVSGTGVVYGVSAGLVTVTYNLSGHHAYATFTVNPAPSAISGTTHVCAGSATLLSSAPFGGTWSSGSPSVGGVDFSGNVSGLAPGTTVISYTLFSGCSASAIVTVNALPSPITGTTSVCTGLTTTLSDPSSPGTWSSSSSFVASVTSSGVVTGGSSGTATISYTSGGCSRTTTVSVLTAPTTAGTITGGSSICAATTTALSDGIAGGTWSSSSPGIATVDGTGLVSGVSGGAVTLTYTVSNICGTVNATSAMTINPQPDAGTIAGTGYVCVGNSLSLTDVATGGVWSSTNTAAATVSATGVVYGVAGGSTTVSYTVTNSCGTQAAVLPVTVVPITVCNTGVAAGTKPQSEEVIIYPNPNRGTFSMNLLSQNNEQAHIVITNIVGEKVKEFTAPTNEVTDVKLDQVPGIYLLSATMTGGKYVAQVVIE